MDGQLEETKQILVESGATDEMVKVAETVHKDRTALAERTGLGAGVGGAIAREELMELLASEPD